ncbi:hypothetical protein C8J57DRAFT_57582 [Mycena rebaudengoi]|nr:hypothetical protein C8J57DRAFT_57582 [Mycena rebaudengoi]
MSGTGRASDVCIVGWGVAATGCVRADHVSQRLRPAASHKGASQDVPVDDTRMCWGCKSGQRRVHRFSNPGTMKMRIPKAGMTANGSEWAVAPRPSSFSSSAAAPPSPIPSPHLILSHLLYNPIRKLALLPLPCTPPHYPPSRPWRRPTPAQLRRRRVRSRSAAHSTRPVRGGGNSDARAEDAEPPPTPLDIPQPCVRGPCPCPPLLAYPYPLAYPRRHAASSKSPPARTHTTHMAPQPHSPPC